MVSKQVFLGAVAWMTFAVVSPAMAQSMTVPAGKRTLISNFALWDTEQCAAAEVPDAKLVKSPQNGRIDFGTVSQTVSGSGCAPFNMTVRGVFYTPKAGFRGEDEVVIDYFFNRYSDAPGGTSRRHVIPIIVK